MRPLPYPLKNPNSTSGATDSSPIPHIVPDGFPIDPDEKTDIVINLSLNEYVILASAVDVGRDIAYDDITTEVWNIWARIFQGASMVNCDDVADCIETSPAVQVSINNYLEQNGQINPDSGGQTATMDTRLPDHATETVATDPDPCDLDALWAGIREMVERIDGEGRDLLEDLAVLNDKVQQIERFINLVPIIGDFIVSVADFFTELVPDLLNDYNAYSSPTALDAVACDIFEMVCSDCRYPTYDELLDYFGSHSMAGLPQLEVSTMAQIWEVAKTLPVGTPSIVWYTVNALQCIVLGLGGTWVGNFGRRTFGIWCSFGEDNPNDNWTILCDACPDPPFELFIDFNLNATGVNPPASPSPVEIFLGSWNATYLAVLCASSGNTRVSNIRSHLGTGMIANWGEVEYIVLGSEGVNNQASMGGIQYAPVFPLLPATLEFADFPIPTPLPTASTTATTNRLADPTSNIGVKTIRIRGNGYVTAEWQPYKVYGVNA